jgi:hypothetical protein
MAIAGSLRVAANALTAARRSHSDSAGAAGRAPAE